MERSYGSLGIPLVFTGVAALVVGIALIAFGWQFHEGPWPFPVVIAMAVGLLTIAFGIVYSLKVPVRLHVRDAELGFTLMNGSTEWLPKNKLTARIARYGSASRGMWVLRFDGPQRRRLVPLAFDPTMFMTDDGLTVEPSNLESVLGMPVERTTWAP